MGALLAVAAAALLIAAGTLRRQHAARLPFLEAFWFHGVVTWPILMKASLGSFLFASALADGSSSYALIVYGPGVVASTLLFLRRLTARGARVFGPGLLVLLGMVLTLPQVLFGSDQPIPVLIALGMALPLALRSQHDIPLSAWIATARWALTAIVASVLLVSIVAPNLIIGACRLDKCSIFGETLISPITNNGNFLGVAVALLLPLALVEVGVWRFLTIAGGSLILIEVSGSRSAMVAAVVVTVTVLLTGVFRRRGTIVNLALFGTLAATLVTALVWFPATFATYRGGLWQRARDLLEGNEIFGLGPSYWSRNEQLISAFPNYSPHNIWLELAVSGGFLLIFLVVTGVWWAIRVIPPATRPRVVLLIVAVLAIGVLEAPVAPSKLGLTPFALLLPLMIAAGYSTTQPSPGSDSSRGSVRGASRSRRMSVRAGS